MWTSSCPYGEIIAEWHIQDGIFALDVQIPEDTVAQIILPDGTKGDYTAGSSCLKCEWSA